MLDWGGFLLLAFATFLGVSASGDPDPVWKATTLGIAAVAAVWLYVGYTRRPLPNVDHLVRLDVFFVGLLVLASILMLRQPLFFIFMIAGFFYATILRPLPLAVVGIAASSILVNTLIAGVPQTAEGVDVLPRDHRRPDDRDQRRRGDRREDDRAERGTPRRRSPGSRRRWRRTPASTPSCSPRHARRASSTSGSGWRSEIHDTIAQGLTGIITQLEAANQAVDRPADRDRHLANAELLARESLTEARRSVEASMPAALESRSLPEALDGVAREWSDLNGIPIDIRVTGEVIALHPDIEVALLRTAQEALANVARHAGATRAGLTLSYMGDVVTLDVRDDGVGFAVPEAGGSVGPGGGFGLTGMRQRVARVAGSLAIESEPGGGTAVSARVPAIGAGPSGAPT